MVNICLLSYLLLTLLVFSQSPPLASGVFSLPNSFKDDAQFWVKGNIKDEGFASDIQNLGIHGVISIPHNQYQYSNPHFPNWLKRTIGWWTEGKITNDELVNSIQWLINHNVMSTGLKTQETTQNPSNVQPQNNATQLLTIPQTGSTVTTPGLRQLYDFALKLVNDDRAKYGLAPVLLSNIGSAQNHADDELKNNYFSHWNSYGVKPYVTYTKLGGRGEVAENIFYEYAYCPTSHCIKSDFDPISTIKYAEYQMMYNDSGSNWGHRNNILDPNHTHVNFGITYDQDHFYFVQNFETNIIKWNLVLLSGSQLELDGQIPSGYSFDQISIFADPLPQILTSYDLTNNTPYNLGYYDQGELVGEIVPTLSPNMHYQECSPGKLLLTEEKGSNLCVDYIAVQNISNFPTTIHFIINLSKWMTVGQLHTVYMSLKDQNNNSVEATSLTLEYLK